MLNLTEKLNIVFEKSVRLILKNKEFIINITRGKVFNVTPKNS